MTNKGTKWWAKSKSSRLGLQQITGNWSRFPHGYGGDCASPIQRFGPSVVLSFCLHVPKTIPNQIHKKQSLNLTAPKFATLHSPFLLFFTYPPRRPPLSLEIARLAWAPNTRYLIDYCNSASGIGRRNNGRLNSRLIQKR